MRVLYFGIYNPSYARNWVIINGLRKNGIEVIELFEKPSKSSLFRLAIRYLLLKEKFDLVIVGFPGQEIMFLAKMIIRKPIIFDAFTSHYGGYILDRKRSSPTSLMARYYRFLDTWSCKFADVILLDTQAHIDFFIREFGLPASKFRRIWIGANDDNFKPVNRQDLFKQVLPVNDKFKVIFFGTYVPLQGVEYIIRAAKLLEHEKDIVFYFFGKGQDKPKCVKLTEELGLKNIEFTDMIKSEELRSKIASADVVLGLFGNTPKTPLVIPNKVYEATAMRKPVITSDTHAIRELFTEDDMFLVNAANPNAIAQAIIKLKNDPSLRMRLAERGYMKFINNASSTILGAQLKLIVEQCLKNKKS